jgi:hypothetical protein
VLEEFGILIRHAEQLTLTRESENSVRTSSWPVISHGLLPSQILTLDSGRAATRGCLARVFNLFGRRVRVEQRDDSVFVTGRRSRERASRSSASLLARCDGRQPEPYDRVDET